MTDGELILEKETKRVKENSNYDYLYIKIGYPASCQLWLIVDRLSKWKYFSNVAKKFLEHGGQCKCI